MDKKTTGIIAYITWVGWLIAYLAGDKEGAKFHLNQALVIWLGYIVTTVISWIPYIRIFAWVLNVFLLVCLILGIVYAIQDTEKEVPILGQIKILK